MTHLNDLAAILVAQAPRQQAAKVLELLVARTRAEGGAVLSFKDGQIILFATSRDIAATRITQATEMWEAHRERLQSGGSAAESGGHVLTPIRDEERLVALLYLSAPQAFDPMAVSTFSVALAKAVQLDGTERAQEPLDEWLGRPEHERERLIAMLNRNEGNIARVARLMGVTRRTIYLRMQRFGVPRIKMPRTNTPRQPKKAPA